MHGTRDEAVPGPPPFEIVLRGFDRQQVIDHVNALKARVASIGAERDGALRRAADLDDKVDQLRREAAETTRHADRLRREAEQAATEVDRLQRSPLAVATARIQRMLQMAEDEATELQRSAEQEALSLRESARAEADQLLAEARRQCDRLDAESTSRRHSAEAESMARRQRAEQQSEQSIASRHAEAQAWVSDYQTRSVAALYLLMQIAGKRLNSRVVKVARQVSAAKVLRSEVTGQLSAVQRLLVEALGVVDQLTPAEQAELAEQAAQAEQAALAQQAALAEQAAQAEQAALAEQAHQAELAQQAAQAEQAELPVVLPAPEPDVAAGRSGVGPGPARQKRPGPAGRPQRADQPTARFGLHP